MGRLSERHARAALRMVDRVGVATTGAVPFARAGVRERPRLVGADDRAMPEATPEPVRGPLAMLYRQARALDAARAMVARYRSWIDAEGWCEIEVDAQCRIRRGGRRGLAMLGVAVPDAGLRPGATLPPALRSWLTRAMAGPAGVARTIAAGGRAFALRALPAVDGDGWLLYVGERPARNAERAAAAAPLSPREREVLEWVAAGKTDGQAAAILGISVRTVQKHLQHVYVKLGVEGRTAAAMRARTGRG